MADSGEPDKSSRPPVPNWAPSSDGSDAPQHDAEPPPAAPASPFGGDYAATMRLIPVPPPTTPPPAVASITPPPQAPGERYIGKYRVKGELGRGGLGSVYLGQQAGLGREGAIQE